jgi:hypothetical protein
MDMLRGGWGPGMLGNGMGVATGGGSSYAAETEAIAAAFTTPPTTARKNLIDACVVSLKTAGVWTKLDALYAFAAADSQAAKINWKAPGTFNCTEVNAPAFTVDRGFTGASTKYLDSGFNGTTAPSPKYLLNDASIFGWSLTSAADASAMIGQDAGSTAAMWPKESSTGNVFGRINCGNINTGVTLTGLGLTGVSRTGATTVKFYRDGASIHSAATASTAVINYSIKFLTADAGYWAGQIAAGGIGGGMTDADNTALYNALRTYMTGVGVP